MKRWVLHMDMDAFFASVEQFTRPTIRDRAVLVGGLGPRGTVAGASYRAREYGARSAMPMSEARRRCPVAVVLPPRFRLYQAVSKQVFEIVRQASEHVEQVSVDEAFLEPDALAGASAGTVQEFASRLRTAVLRQVGVTASVGAGSGKQLAKIASGLAKPDGARIVPPEQEEELLSGLPVRKLWGIGPITESKLHRIGVRTIGDLAALQLGDVISLLGQAHGVELHRLARGIDEHPVAERGEAKQVSAETTFDIDITDPVKLTSEVTGMAEAAHRRLVASGRAARTVTVKARDSTFATSSRAETLPTATSDFPALAAAARRLAPVAAPPGTPVRLVGVSYSGLAAWEQESLFGNPADGQSPSGAAETQASATAPQVSHDPETGAPHARRWQAGDDVHHAEWGHGWVQGSGIGRVTVRFETARTGRGPTRTFAVDDPALSPANPLASLGW
ncbi:DNA polymerase-4 [Haloactinomyces albus]|uniref:DNA polymerase IV n=1 Tax=Haloactinomyces albus TaxID=1352928 RepID=A0AAE3ZD69_9ACTN|nr:DNA polymerase-4 [Haloactinomyces albus]